MDNQKKCFRALLIYNSLMFERHELVCVHVDRLNVLIRNANGAAVPVQLEPIFKSSGGSLAVVQNEYKVRIGLISVFFFSYFVLSTQKINL